MTGKYLLDTSALLAFYQDERGSDIVEDIFKARENGKAEILISFMSLLEVLYLFTAREGSRRAFSMLFQIRSLEACEVWPDDDLIWCAAQIKAGGGLSAADALIAASAQVREATLVHRDREFERLGDKVRRVSMY
jgi:predicted nucleic acid-binding protein